MKLLQGFVSNFITYSTLSSACENCTLPALALEFFEVILLEIEVLVVITYIVLIMACEKGSVPTGANTILRSNCSSEEPCLPMSLPTIIFS